FRGQRLRDLFDWRVFAESDDVASHHLLDRDHAVSSSLATVWKFALPPLSTRPVAPDGSFPARYAASGRAPLGSSARCSRTQATRVAVAISSSLTVTMSSTRRLVTITSKLRSPMCVVLTPSARVAGEVARAWIEPLRKLR